MTPAELSATLLELARLAAGERGGEISPDDVTLERPRNRDHGDWASNVAMKLGKRLGLDPRSFAADLASALSATDGIAAAEVAGPGFLNITLDAAAAGALAKSIVEQGEHYGEGIPSHPRLGGVAGDRLGAGVGVLHVEDRVVVGAPLQNLGIEGQRGIGGRPGERVAKRVGTEPRL